MRTFSIFTSLFLSTTVGSIIFYSCQSEQVNAETTNAPGVVSNTFFHVTAKNQTDAVAINDDAADDPCIWVNPDDKSQSLIIGTNKKYGLEVYDLSGKRKASYPLGRVNNVDIRYNFSLNQDSIAIVMATNRTNNSLTAMKVDPGNGSLELLSDSTLISNVDVVYGFALGQPVNNDVLYAFIVSKTGQFEQWELFDENGVLGGKIVRTYSFDDICEGIVADDYTGMVYINQENIGIWKMPMNPTSNVAPELIVKIEDVPNIVADLEGISIYYASETEGYLIASSQGNNSYAVFNREAPHAYLGSFVIDDNENIDGTQETDGIDVLNVSLPGYPNGIFIAQDGYNKENGQQVNQNFKMVDWAEIANAFEPKLKVSSTFKK